MDEHKTVLRPCMKCRKEFQPLYRFNTICPKCQTINNATYIAATVPVVEHRAGKSVSFKQD